MPPFCKQTPFNVSSNIIWFTIHQIFIKTSNTRDEDSSLQLSNISLKIRKNTTHSKSSDMLDTKDTTYFSSNVQYSLLGHCINNRPEIALMFMRTSKALQIFSLNIIISPWLSHNPKKITATTKTLFLYI